ncbi:hypothetical protein, partial [Faecalibaculum rodentium]
TEVKLRDGDDSRKAKITNGHSDSRFPYGRRLFCKRQIKPIYTKKETWDTISFTEDTILQVSISSF